MINTIFITKNTLKDIQHFAYIRCPIDSINFHGAFHWRMSAKIGSAVKEALCVND